MNDATDRLAVEGGTPVRDSFLPYSKQTIGDDDVAAVAAALRSDWLTTGPLVGRFEDEFARSVDARHAVAVANGTAALHAAVAAVGIGPGDEVIVPALTFAASANCVRYVGGTVVFSDVRRDSLGVDPEAVAALISPRTRAIIAVDLAGQPADLDELLALSDEHGLRLIEDAAHSLGGTYRGRRVGSIAPVTTFSLHPVKIATTGEGGMITTHDGELADRMRRFRNHGITSDHRQRGAASTWLYDISELGFNYRLTDIQCALGLSQLCKVESWLERREAIARLYDERLGECDAIETPTVLADRTSGRHLYVVRLKLDRLEVGRAAIFRALRAENIGVNVHYIPVPWLTYYQELGYGRGRWPVAETEYERVVTLPLFPTMNEDDVGDVARALTKVLRRYGAN